METVKHFLDVGANIGQTFDDFLNKTKDFDGHHVWCFEPSPRHVPDLMAVADKLSQRYKIHICPFGLSDQTTLAKFYQKDDGRGDSLAQFLYSDHEAKNIEVGYELCVSVLSITDFLNFNTKPTDDVTIKLDCEGAEYGILSDLFINGGKLVERIEKVYLELHTTEYNHPKNAQPLIVGLERMGISFEQWKY